MRPCPGPQPCNLLPTPASHPDSREMFLLPIELQPAQYCSSSSSMSGSKPGIEVRSLAAREELSSVRRGLTGSSGQLGEGLVVCVHTTKMSGPPCDRALSASDVVALLGLSPVLEVLRVGSQLHPGFRSKEFSSTSSVLHKVLALWMHSRSRASREAIAGLVPER